MTTLSARDPRFVDAILDWRWTGFLARLALVGAYLLGGIVKASDWPAAVAEQAHFGMQPAAFWAAATIAVEIVGPLLILSGRLVWLGAGMLGAFTLFAAITANAFWAMPAGQDRFMATNAFFEHLGLIGGFVLAAIVAEAGQRRGAGGGA
ncbi:DoxX family protein [Sphingomonas arantia]|uniref:DoxX family protein n=1 Tax=Sphingomonas arantia TaxID=1460676 RepID=A0ABW4U1F0_9SPHN